MTRQERHHLRNGLLFTGPWLLGLSVFIVIPSLMTLWFSFCSYSVLKSPVFVGAENYRSLVSDAIFWKSLWNTFVFAALFLPLSTAVSLGLALLLNGPIPAKGLFRTIFFLPSLVPLVALAILWRWIFQTNGGVLNHGISTFGVSGPDWLGSTFWAKPALVLTGLWGVGHAMVIYLAGLQDVPRSLYEAATLDGAGYVNKTLHVTLPMLSPVIYFNVVIGLIGVLQVFAVPYVMTGGGPARSTLFYTMYLFDQAFRYLNMGYASAMAVVLFLLIAGLTVASHLLADRHVHYAGGA